MDFKITAALVVLSAAGLQGCQTPGVAARGSTLPTYATDLAGKAASCTSPGVKVVDRQEVAASIATGGGGWCAVTVDNGGQPYAAGLLTARPRHGHVYIHNVGDDTRVDYTPYAAAMADTFTVRLIPGDGMLKVAVAPNAVAAATPTATATPVRK